MIAAFFDIMMGGVGNNVALLILRVCLGLFFYLSGSWKVFWNESRARMYGEMVARRIPWPCVMVWFVASVELLSGAALIIGLLTVPAAVGLAIICLTACFTEAEKPTGNLVDQVGDWLYKPDVLLALALLVIATSGSGPWSFDRIICDWLTR